MFENREEAGTLLAQKLARFLDKKNTVVLGVTRGGVVIAKIIADKLKLPLDILVVKKIGLPQEPELAIGAVGPKRLVYWDEPLCRRNGIDAKRKKELLKLKVQEQEEQEKKLRAGGLPLTLKDKTVIVADDGVATGTSAICCSLYLQQEEVREQVLATPVIASDTLKYIKSYFDSIVTLKIAKDFYAVGQFYRDFPQVEDNEVMAIFSNYG